MDDLKGVGLIRPVSGEADMRALLLEEPAVNVSKRTAATTSRLKWTVESNRLISRSPIRILLILEGCRKEIQDLKWVPSSKAGRAYSNAV